MDKFKKATRNIINVNNFQRVMGGFKVEEDLSQIASMNRYQIYVTLMHNASTEVRNVLTIP